MNGHQLGQRGSPPEQSTMESLDTNGPMGLPAPTRLQPRAYQLEMLRESLERNIIVAMDTGSGKTQIAVLRITAELERCEQDKMVWFLAPTVALAEQQYRVLSTQLPAYPSRLLCGADNVDHWRTQFIWDNVLMGKRIVVSTPQVLLDTLTHGFVRLKRIALLVVDEAHHCKSSSAVNRIMQDFYHPELRKISGGRPPHVLGLTASPVTKKGGLEAVEGNMNSVCRTPKDHREEMLKFVHRPSLSNVVYSSSERLPFSTTLQSVLQMVNSYDLMGDPFFKRMQKNGKPSSKVKVQKFLSGDSKTFCHEQLESFYARAVAIHSELGPWGADLFISTCVDKFLKGAESHQLEILKEWRDDEMSYLSKLFKRVTPPRPYVDGEKVLPGSLSIKVKLLIELLMNESHAGFTGIIFVRQRSTAALLAQILTHHPATRSRFSTAPFVGSSGHSNRKGNLFDLADVKRQKEALEAFRWGKQNLIVATSVLEEGIDVSACNLVVRYDKPDNLRSYIQSRGRARKAESKFVIFLDEADDSKAMANWSALEDEMQQLYMDDQRKLAEIAERENGDEVGTRVFVVETTGAKLTLDESVRHLHHFCDRLPRHSYAEEPQPLFIKLDEASTRGFRFKVILPSSVEPALREATSISAWQTEKMAKRDAAFEAYVNLYKAGLVNDNLLPTIFPDSEFEMEEVEKRDSVATVSCRLNPWALPATEDCRYAFNVRVGSGEGNLPDMRILLPYSLKANLSFQLYWNQELSYDVVVEQNGTFAQEDPFLVAQATDLIMNSVWSRRLDSMSAVNGSFPFLLVPGTKLYPKRLSCEAEGSAGVQGLSSCRGSLGDWIHMSTGQVSLAEALDDGEHDVDANGLIRLQSNKEAGRPYILKKRSFMQSRKTQLTFPPQLSHANDTISEEQIEVSQLPKRADFLHVPENNVARSNDSQIKSPQPGLAHTATEMVSSSECLMDRLPFSYAKFALFLPSILHKIEVALMSQHLALTLLAPVEFVDIAKVTQAISSSHAREGSDYQRLEFLGDCVLKYHTVLQLASENPNWHEGYLSNKKDHIVSNSRLCRSAISLHLDQYILLDAFTGYKWRPPLCLEKQRPTTTTRDLSTKIIADVVEAIIGAAEFEGGETKTLACLKIFIAEVRWRTADHNTRVLRHMIPSQGGIPSLNRAEKLIGYNFARRMLVAEALTHPACSMDGSKSYQRLEFMGDAILDHIVVSRLFAHPKTFDHRVMHLMRSALTSADFLGFLCLDTYTEELAGDAIFDPSSKNVETTTTVRPLYLWQFMRHSASFQIAEAQQQCFRRYEKLRDPMREALREGKKYPWTLLAQLDADKMYSDLIESLLAAIFIDSGSMERCTEFLERIGLIRFLDRIMDEYNSFGGIVLEHPKTILGMLANQNQETVKYACRSFLNDDGHMSVACEVTVGVEKVFGLTDGISKVEAETRAAEEAVLLWKNRKMVLD